MTAEIQPYIDGKRTFGNAVCQRIAETIAKLGFSQHTQTDLPVFDAAEFSLVTDPFTQSLDLVGYWYNAGKQRIGQIKFHGDGSFYAEYDVVKPHPRKQKIFVEAINAWGKQDDIKSEANFLDMPE